MSVFRRRQWLAAEVSLYRGAPFPEQEIALLPALHSFRQYRHTKASPKSDHGPDDRHGVPVRRYVRHEGTVDLDQVEWKGMQIGKRGVARPEIVESDVDAQCLEAVQHRHRTGEVTYQDSLGDLQLEARGAQSGFDEDGMNERGKIAMAELLRRDIHAYLEGIRPSRRFAAGLPERPFAQRQDQIRLLFRFNENRRRDKAALGAIPPGQRFAADQRPIGCKLRLIVQREFAFGECVPEIFLPRATCPYLVSHLRRKELDGTRFGRLRAVECDVGVAE